jgi:lysyl-tRNA synthetase class 1
LKIEVIGRGTWLDKVAANLISKEQKLGRSLKLIRVESGLGASGIPHVGSLGDAVRAYGVLLALKNIGFESELIAYSDDMDGLRKVPEGLPDWLKEHLGKPVSAIPDPFDCHKSYGEHMSSILTEGLDRLGIEYRFQSGAESYRKGLLNDQILKILENRHKIGLKISELLGQKKFENVLPYYPICDSCGRIYVAEAHDFDSKTGMVHYRCNDAEIGKNKLNGCGHEGKTDIKSGRGKLSWKGEFAARWAALDIRFEAFGKDISDSVKINDWISEEILNFPPPHHVKYELFLDKSGKKISKSIGNVFTPQAWLNYGTPESLFLLMYKRIAGTRNLSVKDIPLYMDEYNFIEDIYFGKIKEKNPAKLQKYRGLYEYINHLNPPNTLGNHSPYRLMAQLTMVSPEGNAVEYVVEKLKSYQLIKEEDEAFNERIKLAHNWAKEFLAIEKTRVQLRPDERRAIIDIVRFIKETPSPEVLQNKIFEAAKLNRMNPVDLFKLLYQILLGTEKGPRLGPYITDIGLEKAAERLSEQLI